MEARRGAPAGDVQHFGRHRRRRWAFASVLAPLLVALSLLLVPVGSGRGVFRMTAPYLGFAKFPFNAIGNSSCGQETTPVSGTWNSTNGAFQFDGYANAGPCAVFASGGTEAIMTIDSSAFLAPLNGTGSVSISFAYAFTAKALLHFATPTSARSFPGYASTTIEVQIASIDVTHHHWTQVGVGHTFLIDTILDASPASFSFRQPWTGSSLSVPTSFVAGDDYLIQVIILANVETVSYGGGTVANASLDMAAPGGLTIGSLTAA
jgi:hypothetical protein